MTTRVEHASERIVSWSSAEGRNRSEFHGAWTKAFAAAGRPAKRVRDLQLTAVREMEGSTVPRSTAMTRLSGHKTESICRRYAIVSEEDLAEGVKRREEFRKGIS